MVQKQWLVEVKNRLNIIDWATIIYAFSTLVWILIFYNKIELPFIKICFRFGVVLLIFFIIKVNKSIKNIFTDFLRYFYPIILLSYWYGETADINKVIFEPFDNLLYNIDQIVFGFQPSLKFSENYSSNFFSEIINFGYFSYYFLNIITFLLVYVYSKKQILKAVFIMIVSFFIYYWIFILFPVVGPQFWLPEALRSVPDGYIFREGVKLVQYIGEKPTGAFPSSHVGMTIIFLILTYQTTKKGFYLMLPVSIILGFATIYIKAHYFIDVIFGIFTGFLFYFISLKIFKITTKK